ncbi:MAG TPA: hypothetical protein VHJ19_08680 [Gammaproteobacteria bacterium]|nr:hypothetical protein [Gammaproteobacteria bacterium]
MIIAERGVVERHRHVTIKADAAAYGVDACRILLVKLRLRALPVDQVPAALKFPVARIDQSNELSLAQRRGETGSMVV